MRKDYLIGSAVLWAVLLPVWLVWQWCATARGDEPPASIQRLLDESKIARNKEIEKIGQQIKQATSSRQKIPNRAKVLKDLKSRLKFLKSESAFKLPALEYPPKQGNIGTLEYGGKVFQVLNEKEMLVDLTFVTFRQYNAGRSNLKGEAYIVTEPVQHHVTVLMRGFPTVGNSDDAPLVPNPVGLPVELTSTYTYTTAAGTSRTVLVVEPFDMKRLDPYLPKKKP